MSAPAAGTGGQHGLIMGLLCALLLLGAPEARAAGVGILVGNWVLEKDQDDNTFRAVTLDSYGDGIALFVEPGANAAYAGSKGQVTEGPDGTLHVTIRVGGSLITGIEDYETEDVAFEIRPEGRDSAQLWLAGSRQRWGTMKRTACDLVLQFRSRGDTPPSGCQWTEFRGVGFSGLEGECRFYDDWNENWSREEVDALGQIKSACLVAEPSGFPGM
jgi:hypothetical protein